MTNKEILQRLLQIKNANVKIENGISITSKTREDKEFEICLDGESLDVLIDSEQLSFKIEDITDITVWGYTLESACVLIKTKTVDLKIKLKEEDNDNN